MIASKIAEGFNSIEKIGNNYWFTDGKGQGINLSENQKGYLGLSKSRALIEAMIAEAKAAKTILPVEEKAVLHQFIAVRLKNNPNLVQSNGCLKQIQPLDELFLYKRWI